MTKHMAIEIIKRNHCTNNEHCTDSCMYNKENCAYFMAMEALKNQSMINTILNEMWALNEISKDYCAIGTLEEFKELKEKATPKKPINKQGFPRFGYCPACKKTVTKSSDYVGCSWCLQTLDWSE